MSKRTKLGEDEIRAAVQSEIANCDGQIGSQLANERAENLDYYFCRPFGNEQEGRSKVVDGSVRDTIEWVMPTLMRVFAGSEKICEFEPEEQSDIEAAKQATEYVNFQWNRDNPGFINTYTWFKDGLLSKNGIVKIYWTQTEKVKRERYSGLDDEAFAQLVNDDAVVVSEHTETKQTVIMPDMRPEGFGAPVEQEVTYHDVVLTRTTPFGKVCIEPTPPEEFLISKDARSIPEARMVGHKRLRTLSSLVEDGYDLSLVETLTAGEDEDTSAEALARDSVNQSWAPSGPGALNKAMREVWVYEVYLKIDVDGDGIAEMRKITCAGPGYTILDNEAWDAPRPFVSLSPILLPHRFVGLALADLAKYFQLLRSTILRQYLDNMYQSNNQREEVDTSNIVDPTEVLSNKPGQKIRKKNGNQAIIPVVVPQIGGAALEGLTYLDQLREQATGVSARTQGLGANALHDTMGGEKMLMSAAMGKIELIARVYGDAMKEAFRLIHKLNCMYQDKPRIVRLTGKEFVEIDPRGWNSDMDMTVSVGIGMGDQAMQLQAATLIGQAQAAGVQSGLLEIKPENAMATFELLVNATGQKGADRFAGVPDPNAPPKPSPEMMKVQAQAQADATKAQMDAQAKAQQSQADAALKTQAQQQDASLAQQRLNAEMALKKYQTDQELALKRQQLEAELQLKREQMAAELQLKAQMGAMSFANDASADIGQVNVGGDPG